MDTMDRFVSWLHAVGSNDLCLYCKHLYPNRQMQHTHCTRASPSLKHSSSPGDVVGTTNGASPAPTSKAMPPPHTLTYKQSRSLRAMQPEPQLMTFSPAVSTIITNSRLPLVFGTPGGTTGLQQVSGNSMIEAGPWNSGHFLNESGGTTGRALAVLLRMQCWLSHCMTLQLLQCIAHKGGQAHTTKQHSLQVMQKSLGVYRLLHAAF